MDYNAFLKDIQFSYDSVHQLQEAYQKFYIFCGSLVFLFILILAIFVYKKKLLISNAILLTLSLIIVAMFIYFYAELRYLDEEAVIKQKELDRYVEQIIERVDESKESIVQHTNHFIAQDYPKDFAYRQVLNELTHVLKERNIYITSTHKDDILKKLYTLEKASNETT